MTAPSPRTAFWVGLLIVAWSGQMNFLLGLLTWSAVGWILGPEFADTHYLFVRISALVIHVALYLAVLAAVKKLLPPRTPKAHSITTLVTSIAYAGLTLGLAAYSLTFGALP
jgi:hypothetical protein